MSLSGCEPIGPTMNGPEPRQTGEAAVPTSSSPNPPLQILDWWQTVDIEHQDRKARLQRLASLHYNGPAPRFYEYVIPSRDLQGVPVDIPVLRVVFPERVFFDTDKSEIRPEAEPVLDLVAESLRREPPDVALFVAGHTDSRGSEAYNYNLSVDRANSVANALLKRGVGRSAIWRVGFGKAIPLASNDTPEGMALNRRVEFLFAAVPRAAAVWLARQSEDPCFGRTGSDAAHCKRPVPAVQREYVAVPLSVTRTAAAVSQPNRQAIDINPDQAFRIDLDNKRVTIEAPRL
jgi:outer membrane protein OmpA-like peptidoglycan-associated protein